MKDEEIKTTVTVRDYLITGDLLDKVSKAKDVIANLASKVVNNELPSYLEVDVDVTIAASPNAIKTGEVATAFTDLEVTVSALSYQECTVLTITYDASEDELRMKGGDNVRSSSLYALPKNLWDMMNKGHGGMLVAAISKVMVRPHQIKKCTLVFNAAI